MARCKILGIAGGSGSGKTTLARHLVSSLGEQGSILYQDAYYRDQSARFDGDGGSVNFDDPEAIDWPLLREQLGELLKGHPVEVPRYDFVEHVRSGATDRFEPTPWILLDGTLILNDSVVRDLLSDSIFVAAEEDLRFSRRLERDIKERGREEEGVRRQFYGQVKPMHDQFVEPSKSHAGTILVNEDLEAFARDWVSKNLIKS